MANGVECKDHAEKKWKNAFDPVFYSKTKTCVGYRDVNETVACIAKGFSDTNARRLCKCVESGKYNVIELCLKAHMDSSHAIYINPDVT